MMTSVLKQDGQRELQGSPTMLLEEKPIAQAARYMSPGNFLAIPREYWSDSLTRTEATNFISWLTNLAMSQVTDRIAAFLDFTPRDFRNTATYGTVLQSLTDTLIEQSRVAVIPPFAFPDSRAWKARLAVIRYLTAILVESDRDVNLEQGQYSTMLCEYDGVNFRPRQQLGGNSLHVQPNHSHNKEGVKTMTLGTFCSYILWRCVSHPQPLISVSLRKKLITVASLVSIHHCFSDLFVRVAFCAP